MRKLLKNLKGNSLLVVLMTVFLIGASATTILFIGSDVRIAAIKAEGAADADAYAMAGLNRAIAYLDAISASGEVDFDLALDPALDPACSDQAPSTSSVPVWSDTGSSIVTFRGLQWRVVPFGDGAYLVRFDDDDDDDVDGDSDSDSDSDSDFAAVIPPENLLGASNNGCDEGPDLSGGEDNVDRDRNRALYITAIGIEPGTDPDAATHVSVRRQYFSRAAAPVAGTIPDALSIGGNLISGAVNGDFFGCSAVGGARIGGNVDNTIAPGPSGLVSDICICGDSEIGGTASGLPLHCNDPILSNVCTAGGTKFAPAANGCAPGTFDTALPTVPTPVTGAMDAATWSRWNWNRPCNFAITNIAGGELWFWDSTATRGPLGAVCGTYDPSSDGVANAPAFSATAAGNFNDCWTPLLTATTGPFEDYAFGGLCGGPSSEACADSIGAGNEGHWCPNANACAAAEYVQVGTDFRTDLNVSAKPQWANACQINYPPPSGPAIDCASHAVGTRCNGNTRAFEFNAARSPNFFLSPATPTAAPAGVYIYMNGEQIDGDQWTTTAPDPGFNTAVNWPLTTIVTAGGLRFDNTPAVAGVLRIGTGDASSFDGLVTNNSIDIDSNARLWVLGTVTSQNNVRLTVSGARVRILGEVHVQGNIEMNAGGTDFIWDYAQALRPPPGAGVAGVGEMLPTLSRSQ